MKIYGILVLLGILGALIGISSKVALTEVTPVALVFSRYLIALILLTPFLKVLKGRTIRELFLLFTISLGLVGNIVLFGYGVNLTNASSAQMMYMSLPILTLIFSTFILKEKVKRNKVVGIILGLIGVSIVFVVPKFSSGDLQVGSIAGNFIVSLAVLSYTFYTIFSKKFSKFTPMELTVGGTISVFIVTSFFAFWEIYSTGGLYSGLTIKGLLNLLFLGIGGTVVYYFLYQYLIKITSPTTSSFVMYLQVFFSIIGSSIFLGESIGILFLLGTVFAVMGVFIVNKK